jgi:hypothetical protein
MNLPCQYLYSYILLSAYHQITGTSHAVNKSSNSSSRKQQHTTHYETVKKTRFRTKSHHYSSLFDLVCRSLSSSSPHLKTCCCFRLVQLLPQPLNHLGDFETSCDVTRRRSLAGATTASKVSETSDGSTLQYYDEHHYSYYYYRCYFGGLRIRLLWAQIAYYSKVYIYIHWYFKYYNINALL